MQIATSQVDLTYVYKEHIGEITLVEAEGDKCRGRKISLEVSSQMHRVKGERPQIFSNSCIMKENKFCKSWD